MIVIDTSALIAVLQREPEADKFRDIMSRNDNCTISALTLYEATIVVRGKHGADALEDLQLLIEAIEARIVPFDEVQMRLASKAYSRFGKGIHPAAALNLCDCAAYALAKSLDVPLLFKGNDFSATDIQICVEGDHKNH